MTVERHGEMKACSCSQVSKRCGEKHSYPVLVDCKLGLSESRIKLIANLVCNRENKDIAP